jgi:hypothetical protein
MTTLVLWESERIFATRLASEMIRHAKPRVRLRVHIVKSEEGARNACQRGAQCCIAAVRDAVPFMTRIATELPACRLVLLAEGLTFREVDELDAVGVTFRPKNGALDEAERLVNLALGWSAPTKCIAPTASANTHDGILDELERMRGNFAHHFAELERRLMVRALERFGGNISMAARWIGWRRTTYFGRLRKCGLKPSSERFAAAE